MTTEITTQPRSRLQRELSRRTTVTTTGRTRPTRGFFDAGLSAWH